jgi:putative FmdB family regulatory protein
MPIYQYQCSSCDMMFETLETMTENYERPTPHCPKCDPEEKEDTTMFKYLGNCRPAFNLKEGRGGFNRPGWQ